MDSEIPALAAENPELATSGDPVAATAQELFRWSRLLQAQLGWTDARLAEDLGMSPTQFSRLRNGQRPLNRSTAKIFLDFFQKCPEPSEFRPAVFECLSMKKTTTLRQAFDDFIIAKTVTGLSDTTITFYKSNGERALWFFEKHRVPNDVKRLTAAHIRALLYYVKTAVNRWQIGSISSRKHASPATVDAYWRTIQAWCAWMVEEELFTAEDNPMRKVPRPKVDDKITKEITPELYAKARDSFDPATFTGRRNRALMALKLDSGGRLAEICGLYIEHLDLPRGCATVTGKGAKDRFIGIGDTAKAEVLSYLELHPHPQSGPLWVCEDGHRFSRSGVQSIYRRLKKLGGGVRWSAHTFRSTWAVNMIRNGCDVFTLQVLGGWCDLTMPRHYTRALTTADALRVHRRASPADRYMAGIKTGEPDESDPGPPK